MEEKYSKQLQSYITCEEEGERENWEERWEKSAISLSACKREKSQ
jgi:hypothetical protein